MIPQTRAPTEADIDQVVAAQSQALDKTVQMSSPTGRYTPARLATFAKAVQSVMSILAPDGQPVSEDFSGLDFKNPVQMPTDLVASYLSVRSAKDAYEDLDEASEDEGSDLPDPGTLVDDSNLAMAIAKLTQLAKDWR